MNNPISDLMTDLETISLTLKRIPEKITKFPIFQKFIKNTENLKTQLESYLKNYEKTKIIKKSN